MTASGRYFIGSDLKRNKCFVRGARGGDPARGARVTPYSAVWSRAD